MRAVVVTESGGPDVLSISEVATPSAGVGEVRVRVRAFGVNRADLLQRRGLYPAPAGAPQDILGLEYAGEVDGVGEGVTGVDVGAAVMGLVGGGAYAEYLVTPANHLLAIPDGVTFEQAAAIPEAFITAYDALERASVVKDEWVLITAVGSGVGTAAVQLVRARGARSVGSSRTGAKLDRAKELGLNVGVNITETDLSEAVPAAAVKGVDVALDLVGGPVFAQVLRVMAPRGRAILIGLTGGRTVELDLAIILSKRLRIEGTVLRSRAPEEKAELVTRVAAQVIPLFATQQLHPVIDRVVPFKRVQEAHQYVESDTNFGKVIVSLDV